MKKYECVVVANGLFPSRPELLQYIQDAEYVVACDGVMRNLEIFRAPDAIVGDLDSLSEELRLRYSDRIYKFTEQDTNDLTKAIHHVREKGFSEVLILGATGLREDHTLGNIALLLDYALDFKQVELCSDYGCFTPLHKTTVLESFPGQQVSLFSLYPHGSISVEGLRYPIENRRFYSWWEATLNETMGDQFSIILNEEARVIVYRAWAKK